MTPAALAAAALAGCLLAAGCSDGVREALPTPLPSPSSSPPWVNPAARSHCEAASDGLPVAAATLVDVDHVRRMRVGPGATPYAGYWPGVPGAAEVAICAARLRPSYFQIYAAAPSLARQPLWAHAGPLPDGMLPAPPP